MSPRLSKDNHADEALRDAILESQRLLARLISRIARSDIPDGLRRQFRRANTFPARSTPLRHHVGRVRGVRPRPDVGWLDAGRIVATRAIVAPDGVIREGEGVRDLPCHDVGGPLYPSDLEAPVTALVLPAVEDQAPVWQARRQWFSERRQCRLVLPLGVTSTSTEVQAIGSALRRPTLDGCATLRACSRGLRGRQRRILVGHLGYLRDVAPRPSEPRCGAFACPNSTTSTRREVV